MKLYTIPAFLIGSLLLLNSCGGNSAPKEEATEPAAPAEPTCTYTYDNTTTEVYWNAFKHTAKAKVAGQFTDVDVNGGQTADNPHDAIKGLQFVIQSGNIDTQDPDRDAKIVKFFFEVLTNTAEITGTVKEASGTESGGTAVISLKFNDMEKDVTGEYTLEDTQVRLTVEMNLEEWNGQDALASLNEACSEKHTGTDGENVLWPDVKAIVETNLTKDCSTPAS